MTSPLSLLIILGSTVTYSKATPVFGPDRIYFSRHHDISGYTNRKQNAEAPRAAASRNTNIGDVVDVAVGAGSAMIIQLTTGQLN